MSYIYPEYKFGDPTPIYYVEFDRGSQKNTFTLFKRQFIIPPDEWAALRKVSDMNDFCTSLMSNEGHPWNIMTDKYGYRSETRSRDLPASAIFLKYGSG